MGRSARVHPVATPGGREDPGHSRGSHRRPGWGTLRPVTGDLRTVRRPSLGPVADDWDRVVAASAHPSPFLRSWWLDHAAQGEPAIVCCLDDDEGLVGGAAFQVDRVGRGRLAVERIRSLGQGVLAPDHLDVVALEDRGDQVLDAVLAWLHRPGSRLVDLDGLRADGRLAAALGGHVVERTTAPYATLPGAPGSPDARAYLDARAGQVRSTISRTRKRLTKAGCTVARVEADEVDRALEDLARLHDGRWGDASDFLEAWERFRAAARAGFDRDEVWATEVRTADGTVVATEWDLLTDGTVAFYQSGRSLDREWRGAGSVVRADVVEAAAASGRAEYDLLRGDESYKSDWATGHREVVRVRLGVGPMGRAVAAAAASWRRIAPTVLRVRTRIGDRTD